MINRINQIMELANGKKYLIFKQAIYKNQNYYISVRITDDEEDILDELVVFKDVVYKDQDCMQKVDDPNLLTLIFKYVGLVNEEDVKRELESIEQNQ